MPSHGVPAFIKGPGSVSTVAVTDVRSARKLPGGATWRLYISCYRLKSFTPSNLAGQPAVIGSSDTKAIIYADTDAALSVHKTTILDCDYTSGIKIYKIPLICGKYKPAGESDYQDCWVRADSSNDLDLSIVCC